MIISLFLHSRKSNRHRLWAFSSEHPHRLVHCCFCNRFRMAWSTPGVQMGGRCGHVHCGAYECWYIVFMLAKISAVIAYQTTLTFWTAAFPGLARNTPQLRAKAEEYNAGQISRDEYDYEDTMQRSRLSNMAFYIQSCGEIVILAVIVGVLYGVNVRGSEANNNWGLSVLIAFATGVWLVLAIPWFVLEKRRPGQPLPPNMNMCVPSFPAYDWDRDTAESFTAYRLVSGNCTG